MTQTTTPDIFIIPTVRYGSQPVIIRHAEPLNRFLGRCEACVYPVAVTVDDHTRFDIILRPCPLCAKTLKLERLYGTTDTMACDGTCEWAIGSDCSCACGGENHGGRYFASGTLPAHVVAEYRARVAKRAEGAQKRALKAQEKRAAREAELQASLELKATHFWSQYPAEYEYVKAHAEYSKLLADVVKYGSVWPWRIEQVSNAIKAEIKAQTASQTAPVASIVHATEPGYYLHNGTVYLVVVSQAGRSYAKRLVLPAERGEVKGRAQWVYDKGEIYNVPEGAFLTIEDAAKFGHLHGYCARCGLRLDDPTSVEKGIGPVCQKKLLEGKAA